MPKIPLTIFLIEDDEMILRMYAEKLKLAKFNVFTANNGIKGFELIKKRKPNLIISDLVMPNGDGFELLRELKKCNETKNIPVIALTNLNSDNDKKEVMALGAVDYLVKSDNTPSEVIKKIKNILKNFKKIK